jgi:hypothetical protein
VTISLLQSGNNLNTTIIRYLHDQQFQSLVVRRTGLTGDCLLPTSLTELTGFMPVGIMGSFSDDLHTTVSERFNSQKSRTFTLSIFPTALSRILAFPIGRSSSPARATPPVKLRKGVSYRFGKKRRLHLPAREGWTSKGRSELKALWPCKRRAGSS